STAAVVTMLQVNNFSGPQFAQSPANTAICRSAGVMKYGCFPFFPRTHSYQPSAGTRHRRRSNALANALDVATVSARALIIRAPARGSLAQCGSRPQRATFRWRDADVIRTTGTGSVGATL